MSQPVSSFLKNKRRIYKYEITESKELLINRQYSYCHNRSLNLIQSAYYMKEIEKED